MSPRFRHDARSILALFVVESCGLSRSATAISSTTFESKFSLQAWYLLCKRRIRLLTSPSNLAIAALKSMTMDYMEKFSMLRDRCRMQSNGHRHTEEYYQTFSSHKRYNPPRQLGLLIFHSFCIGVFFFFLFLPP